MGNSADPAVQTAQISAKSAQAQAVLESAKNRLATTTQMLTTAQDNYVKTTDMLLQQQNKLADIQATLTNLTASNISLVSDCYIAVFEAMRYLIGNTGRDQAHSHRMRQADH
jgi:hypothetical protein